MRHIFLVFFIVSSLATLCVETSYMEKDKEAEESAESAQTKPRRRGGCGC